MKRLAASGDMTVFLGGKMTDLSIQEMVDEINDGNKRVPLYDGPERDKEIGYATRAYADEGGWLTLHFRLTDPCITNSITVSVESKNG